ncbi:unnamed protein product [Amoebophrya sp. A120]|nr:unnamed protein product [Amoebophrya sp. A120]|eukprot:GSA120T00006756001.1
MLSVSLLRGRTSCCGCRTALIPRVLLTEWHYSKRLQLRQRSTIAAPVAESAPPPGETTIRTSATREDLDDFDISRTSTNNNTFQNSEKRVLPLDQVDVGRKIVLAANDLEKRQEELLHHHSSTAVTPFGDKGTCSIEAFLKTRYSANPDKTTFLIDESRLLPEERKWQKLFAVLPWLGFFTLAATPFAVFAFVEEKKKQKLLAQGERSNAGATTEMMNQMGTSTTTTDALSSTGTEKKAFSSASTAPGTVATANAKVDTGYVREITVPEMVDVIENSVHGRQASLVLLKTSDAKTNFRSSLAGFLMENLARIVSEVIALEASSHQNTFNNRSTTTTQNNHYDNNNKTTEAGPGAKEPPRPKNFLKFISLDITPGGANFLQLNAAQSSSRDVVDEQPADHTNQLSTAVKKPAALHGYDLTDEQERTTSPRKTSTRINYTPGGGVASPEQLVQEEDESYNFFATYPPACGPYFQLILNGDIVDFGDAGGDQQHLHDPTQQHAGDVILNEDFVDNPMRAVHWLLKTLDVEQAASASGRQKMKSSDLFLTPDLMEDVLVRAQSFVEQEYFQFREELMMKTFTSST